ncbi:MAG: hypothetical protein KDJ37_15865 [Hyphomicrobiaceae bacterium]|nr:hypothetical protein [Hyphomicrobiaceae bacterium]
MDIWLVDVDDAADALEREEARSPRLPRADSEAMAVAFGNIHVRRRRLAHIALRLALARATGGSRFDGVDFHRSEMGKPSLPGGGLAFNLSHAGPAALIAIARREDVAIGIDLEERRALHLTASRRDRILAAADAMSPGAPLAATGSDDAVLQAWVRIEAAAKALDTGIFRLLGALGVAGPGEAAAVAEGVAAGGGIDLAAAFSAATGGKGAPCIRVRDIDPCGGDAPSIVSRCPDLFAAVAVVAPRSEAAIEVAERGVVQAFPTTDAGIAHFLAPSGAP